MSATAAEEIPLTPLERELEEVRERLPAATMRQVAGQWLVTVSDMPLPPGWNQRSVTVHFLVPAGYPHANPDSFYTDDDFRLANGSMPSNATLQAFLDVGQVIWFSYHLQRAWKPGRDRLQTWVATIRGRLADLR
jgi:hypothetical protein